MAGQSDAYKYKEEIDYVADLVGGDVERDLLRIAIEQSNEQLDVTDRAARALGVVTVDGTPIEEALASVGADHLLVGQPTGETFTVEQSGVVTIQEDTALDASGATVPVDVQNSSTDGTEYPESVTVGHDLTGGDLTVGPVRLDQTQALLISANSTDGNTWSASVQWTDGNGNVIQTESASTINLSGVTQDWARLIRKSTHVTVTFTDDSGATSNNLNAHVDAHR